MPPDGLPEDAEGLDEVVRMHRLFPVPLVCPLYNFTVCASCLVSSVNAFCLLQRVAMQSARFGACMWHLLAGGEDLIRDKGGFDNPLDGGLQRTTRHPCVRRGGFGRPLGVGLQREIRLRHPSVRHSGFGHSLGGGLQRGIQLHILYNYNIPAVAMPGGDQSFAGARATCDVQGLGRLAMAKWPEAVHTPAPQRVSISVLEKVRASMIVCTPHQWHRAVSGPRVRLGGQHTAKWMLCMHVSSRKELPAASATVTLLWVPR